MAAKIHNATRWLVLLWFALWMGVVMPGHTRGVVRLPGMADTQDAPSCCCNTDSTCDLGAQDEDAPADPAKCCAVCYFNATLNTPPPLTFYTPYLGQLDEIEYAACEAVAPHQCRAPRQYRGRPPPSA
ncbi:MAG: hypothetical protein ACIAXF_00300 [Phycisphaerales bacterium JB063]